MKKVMILFAAIAGIGINALTSNDCLAQKKIRVLYVGDAGVVLGPNIVASPFYYEQKGYEVHIWCQPVLDALKAEKDITVDHMPTWIALKDFPETAQDIAAKYDVVVLSDVEQESLVLYPWERMMQSPMGPNRLVSIREFVKNGGALIMVGGWQSFTGRRGIGDWGNTPVEEALPVTCLQVNDDRHETPEGVHIEVLDQNHPAVKGLKWESCPVFSGYNRIVAKPGAKVLAKVKEFGDPFIVVQDYGKGRSMAFASDISPHWGAGYQKWENYGKSFVQMIRWLGTGK
ncbi:MAG: glutamine amidotransferase [Bacteroidota bacterium]|nr:glutamine amidotransferase [Bacteroidota bacterium]